MFYSKWFFAKLGHEGLNNLLAAYPDKSAQAVCTFAYCEGPGHEPVIFQGRIDVSSHRHLLFPFLCLTKIGQDSISKRSNKFR